MTTKAPKEDYEDPQYEEDAEDFQMRKAPQYARMTSLALGLTTLAAISIGVYFFLDHNDIELRQQANQQQHANFQGTVSMATIAEHGVPENCWMALHGNVYDLTEYAPIHPGAPTLITDHCGTDASKWYDFEHSTALLKLVDQFLLGSVEERSAVVVTVAPSVDIIAAGTSAPTVAPSPPPSRGPTLSPTPSPTQTPTRNPTRNPTAAPTAAPTTPSPTRNPTPSPTRAPVESDKTQAPTTLAPTRNPTAHPTRAPTATPTAAPTATPTAKPTAQPTRAPTAKPTAAPTASFCAMEQYTLQDVAQHDDVDSCWYVLYGVVYDFTDYIDEHKGGRGTILNECGTDATVAYVEEKKHDEKLLQKKGGVERIIGRLGTTRGQQRVPCDELERVSVTTDF